jgi:hypothetical protein
MIIFNLLLNRRDGQYFVAVATVSKTLPWRQFEKTLPWQQFQKTLPCAEILSWHKTIAPCPVP